MTSGAGSAIPAAGDVRSGVQGLTLGDSELREYTHGLFGHVARMLGPGFQPYLHAAVAAAVESCGQVRASQRSHLLEATPTPGCAHLGTPPIPPGLCGGP